MYRESVRAWFQRRGAQDATAEDLTQNVLLQMYKSLSTYKSERGPFRPWLRTVLHHALCDFQRSAGKQALARGGNDSDAHAFWDQLADLHVATDLESSLHFVDSALDTCVSQVRREVAPQTWQAFYQTAIEEQEPRGVANALGMSVAAVYQARYRVTTMLRACRADRQSLSESS